MKQSNLSSFRREKPTSKIWHYHFFKNYKPFLLFLLVNLALLPSLKIEAQTLFENGNHKFTHSGYIRTGKGWSEGGGTQAHFQIPGAQNKYSLGNQADTYGEIEFDYTNYLNDEKTKSIDVIWMGSIYEDFGTTSQMSYNKTEQLYTRANNLLGKGEVIWAGKRFYDRRAIHLMDRQWVNPGQRGWGFGIEKLVQKNTSEDIKLGAWTFQEQNHDISFLNGNIDKLRAYTADARWINHPISETLKLNLSLNYTYRQANKVLEYDGKTGFAAISWLDYEKKSITNTTALIFRQGASIPIHHWSGMSEKENPGNDNLVLNNLNSSYFVEINNNFLYDDKEDFAFNGILSAVIRDHGTNPYLYNSANPSNPTYLEGRGSKFYWLSAAARGMYYISDYFKLSLDYSYEYVDNRQLDLNGNLNRVSFIPEFSLTKGYYSRPVLRPIVTYAFWSDDLKGHIGNSPNGAPFGNKTSGLTFAIQFEIWW